MDAKKNRSAVWAAVLSLVTPGLGHVYAGKLKHGLLLIGFEYGVVLLVGIFGFMSTFYGIASSIVFIAGIYIYAVFNSIRLARKNKENSLKPYNRWYWYLLIFVVASCMAQLMVIGRGKVLGYETYSILAKSMHPTLQVGDLITVTTKYTQPEVGDVVVFLYPKNRDIAYVMRVAALGDDTISIDNGVVIRNGSPEQSLEVPESQRRRGRSVSMTEQVVPENTVFFLGDWRDNSNDSRYWGVVPANDVVGKVTYIWWSKDVGRIGKAVE